MSPNLSDLEFFRGGVRTRAGLASRYSALAGAPQINGVKIYATKELAAALPGARFAGEYLQENFAGRFVLGPFPAWRRTCSWHPPRNLAASTWRSPTACCGRTCRGSMTIRFSIASARPVREKARRSRTRRLRALEYRVWFGSVLRAYFGSGHKRPHSVFSSGANVVRADRSKRAHGPDRHRKVVRVSNRKSHCTVMVTFAVVRPNSLVASSV